MNSSEDIKSWIGKSIKNEDYISDFPVRAMSSVFDYEGKNFIEVPYGWHWLYFLNLPLQKNLGLSDSSRINIVLRSQKKNYVMTSVGGKPAVLIDDYPKNIKEWTAKGGMGILHTTTSSTISQLRKIGI